MSKVALAKSITKESFYGSLNYAESNLVHSMVDRAKQILEHERQAEILRGQILSDIDQFANSRLGKPVWRLRMRRKSDGHYGLEADNLQSMPLQLVE